MNEVSDFIPENSEKRNPNKGTSCVYCIRSKIDNRVYVGSASRCAVKRWRLHKSHLRNGKHHSIFLQRSWNKYGEDAFEFLVITECAPENCVSLEQDFIIKWKSSDNKFGFNISPTAGSCRGRVFRKETLERMAAAKRGKKQTPEHVANMRATKIGKSLSASHKESIRKARLKAPKRSEETRLKIGASSKGRIPSKESRKKSSESLKRVWGSQELLDCHSMPQKEAFKSSEKRLKQSQKMKEVCATEDYKKRKLDGQMKSSKFLGKEHRKKISENVKMKWADPEYKKRVSRKISEGRLRMIAEKKLLASNLIPPPPQDLLP